MNVESAKAFLKSKGFFIDNLWCIKDVTSKYKCTEEQAQDILNTVLGGDSHSINEAISMEAEELGYEEIEES